MITDDQASNQLTIENFLRCPTPRTWLIKAKQHLPTLIIDHAHCELKAASTALSLIFKYPQHHELCIELSKLAREELLHFEKVMEILEQRQIPFQHLSASRYAASLMKLARKTEPEKLIDILIIGSIIEARSCERFLALLPLLDDSLAKFYKSLVKSEARHFESYLNFAKRLSPSNVDERINYLLEKEKALILEPDQCFRFHSGS